MLKRLMAAAGLALTCSVAVAQDATIDLEQGLACADFALRIEIWGNPHRVYRECFDKNGNLVRLLEAGKGSDLVFTNLTTWSTYSLKANGSVGHTRMLPDGSQQWSVEGHYVLVWFPTDQPPGPWTRQFIGRATFMVDSDGTFSNLKATGKQVDICSALS